MKMDNSIVNPVPTSKTEHCEIKTTSKLRTIQRLMELATVKTNMTLCY